MEEQVGQLWHRMITRVARDRYPQAAVRLTDLGSTLGILFRALGGDGGLRVEAAQATEHGGRRRLLQRIAGTGRKAELAWRDAESLRLPERIDLFPEASLNRDLYLWLAALASGDRGTVEPWLARNQRLARQALDRWPGLAGRYRRLVEAHLAQRPNPRTLPGEQAAQERAVRAALEDPGSVQSLPVAPRPPWPVPLWLHPSPPGSTTATAPGDGSDATEGGTTLDLDDRTRRSAQRTDPPDLLEIAPELLPAALVMSLAEDHRGHVDRGVLREQGQTSAGHSVADAGQDGDTHGRATTPCRRRRSTGRATRATPARSDVAAP